MENPFASTNDPVATQGKRRLTWSWMLAGMMWLVGGYCLLSALTLPFAPSVWLGELPVLALLQLPKMAIHDGAQSLLMQLRTALGWSSGSPSPDMIATQPYAMAMMVTLPALVLLAAAAVSRSLWSVRRSAVFLAAAASLDAVVSIWFEQTSRLSLF